MISYDFLNRFSGWTLCRVTGALPPAFLNGCAAGGVVLSGVTEEDPHSLRVRLRTADLKRARQAALRSQCELTVLEAGGAPRLGRQLRRRAFGVLGLLLVFGLLAWSRLYIWEISVTGNRSVSTGRILDGLRECGIDTGSFWPGITSDNLRSELLSELPELAWATVNIYGSRAEVIVRERVPKPEIWRESDPIDLVAGKTGFVTEVRTLNGTALVRPGSAVTAGEALISGAMETAWSGRRLVHATGSVRAETYYELSAVAPLEQEVRRYTGQAKKRWALLVGKNRYNFYGSYSISPGSCDTITDTWRCEWGGIFSLPVSLLRETQREYTTVRQQRDLLRCRLEQEAALHARLLTLLGPDAEIREEHYSASAAGGMLTVCLRARCSEDIAVEAPAEG